VALAAFDLFAGIIATRPTGFGGLTLWLSMMAADGLASRPTRSRSAMTSAWLIFSNIEPSRKAANQR
jgi:hypothetical protein